jgi:hypothetical protein
VKWQYGKEVPRHNADVVAPHTRAMGKLLELASLAAGHAISVLNIHVLLAWIPQ